LVLLPAGLAACCNERIMRAILILGIALPAAASAYQAAEPLTAFPTGGHAVYHLRPATVAKRDGRAIVSASFDGSVQSHTPQGRWLWTAQTGGNMPFDLATADIDGDGLDEALVASADGALYAIDHDGKPLWTFRRTAPLYQVAAARLGDGSVVILTGGVEQVLYEISAKGQVLGTLKTEHCIRHIRAGDISGTGRDYAAVATASTGLTGILSLMTVDPEGLKPVWSKRNLGSFAFNTGRRFFSMELLDLNKDGRQDILLSNGWGENGKIYAFDHTGKQLFAASDKRIPNASYRMNLLQHVKLPGDEYVLGLFANMLIVYNLDGTCRQVLTAHYDFANGAFDRETRTYYLGSSPSGGDGIYALHLDRPGWQAAFESVRPVGTLAQLERNVKELERQVAGFQAPPYQPAPRTVTAIARNPSGRSYSKVRFVDQLTLSQRSDGCAEVWCRDKDGRQSYSLTADDIVARARDKETAGQDFLIWAGHGRAAFMPLSTMERILQAAPRHFYGFEFAEMEGVDDGMREVVEKIIFPLAELCRKHGGRKIVFRNKNIFYTGALYVPFWRKVLTDPGLRDVFVPALEETNSRTPELSLAGRIGLWLTGNFNRWASRVVTDDACFDRMWEWSSQQVMSLHVRHSIANAAAGAEVFFNSVHQGPFSRELERQFTPFYDMLEKGIIHVPLREDLLSVSGVALGMKTPPSELYLKHGINGHRYTFPQDDHSPLVFDRLDAYWGAAPLLPHDFSYYAMNVRRRTPNFLPETPYGLVAIIPDDTALAGSRFDRTISTDGQHFYDSSAGRHGPAEYKSVVVNALREHAARLPVLVRGSVQWSAVRIDSTHIRVTLVDPGYLDPADREANVIFQGVDATACTDILRREALPIADRTVHVRVPMGTLRILDIAHRAMGSGRSSGVRE
jgi:lambda-carrageenase